jgi:hypothetical protein
MESGALGLNRLIDWFRGWCPRETLLGGHRLQRVSLHALLPRRLLRERPLELLLTVLTLAAGLGGFLVPRNFMPATAEVWMLTGSDLSLRSYIDGFEHQVSTVITTPYRESEAPSAVICIWDEEGEREIEVVGLATTFVSYPSRNITVIGDAHIGYDTLPEWRRDDVEMSMGAFQYSVYLSKDGWERVVGEGGGPPLEHYETNLLSLEDAEAVQPPYNLTCKGDIRHKLESSIDSLQSEHRMTFWGLGVEESGLWVTQQADLPLEELLITNPWLKILQRWRLLLTMAGLMAVVLLYRARIRSNSESALNEETPD